MAEGPPTETPFGDFDLQFMCLSDAASKRTLLALGAAPAGRADALGHAVDGEAFAAVPAASVTRHCQRKHTRVKETAKRVYNYRISKEHAAQKTTEH